MANHRTHYFCYPYHFHPVDERSVHKRLLQLAEEGSDDFIYALGCE